MNDIKSMLTILLIVGALCIGFYLYGKSHAKEIKITDTDTLVVIKKDTIQVFIAKFAQIKDTVIIRDSTEIHYDYANLDTIIVKDSNEVRLNIGYDEYFNRFDVVGSFYPCSKTIIKKIYIEPNVKRSLLYSHISALANKKNIAIDVDGGFILNNRYHIGITGNTLGYAGIQFGGEF